MTSRARLARSARSRIRLEGAGIVIEAVGSRGYWLSCIAVWIVAIALGALIGAWLSGLLWM